MIVASAKKKRKNTAGREVTVATPAVHDKKTPFVSAAPFARATAANPYKGILGSNEGLSVSTKSGYSTAYGHFESYLGVQGRALKVKLPKMHDLTNKHLKGIPTQHTEVKNLLNGFATYLLEVTWMKMPGKKADGSKESMEECVKTYLPGTTVQYLSYIKSFIVKKFPKSFADLESEGGWYIDLRTRLMMRACARNIRAGIATSTITPPSDRDLSKRINLYLFRLNTPKGLMQASTLATQRSAIGRGGEVGVSTWSECSWERSHSCLRSSWPEVKTGHSNPMLYVCDVDCPYLDPIVCWGAYLITNSNANDRGELAYCRVYICCYIYLY